MMTYTDPDQLRWYALCFYLTYNQLPNRLGFVFYRYPYGNPMVDVDGQPVLDEMGNQKTEPGVEWVPFTMDDLKGLGQRATDTHKALHKELFVAKPSPTACRFCDYESVCPERQAQKAQNRKGPRKDTGPVLETGGFTDLTIGE